MLDLQAVKLIGSPLVLAQHEQVDDLETQLGTPFPAGYREYVTTLGEGILGGDFVRIYPPWRVVKELSRWRERIAQFWFWEESLLTQEEARNAILLGDTMNGDELVFHPNNIHRLVILPISNGKMYDAGDSVLVAVEWMCSSGKLTRRFKTRQFDPFDSRIHENTNSV